MDNLCAKYGKWKVFWALFLSLSTLLVVMAAISFIIHRSVTYQGQRFRVSQRDADQVVLVSSAGSILTGELSGRDITIHTPNGTIRHEFGRTGAANTLAGSGWVFTFPDGVSVVTSCTSSPGCQSIRTHLGTDEWRLYQRIRNRYFVFEDESIQFILIPFVGVFLIALGLGQIIYPKSFWELKHIFTVRNGRPTDFAIYMHRFGGYVSLGIVFFGGIIIYYLFAWR